MQITKGIILAGGIGSRLYPITLATNKMLLPIYDKPVIYYPLATLMSAGINDILIISTEEAIPSLFKLLGDGHTLGISITYAIQTRPEGIAQAFIIGEKWLNKQPCVLILGDNIFYSQDFASILGQCCANMDLNEKATIFGYKVADPERFGVAEFDSAGKVISIEEKPQKPKSDYCVTGLYVYPSDIVDYAKSLTKSARNEYEITDLNNIYLNQSRLDIIKLPETVTWFDIGTPAALLYASKSVQKIEDSTHSIIAWPEVIAYQQGWISLEKLSELSKLYPSTYIEYINSILNLNQTP